MKVIKRNICLEELKSRIPGLFPYLEFDEFGRAVIHKATDSVDGCYGKIVPNFNGIPYRTLIDKYYSGENVPIGPYTFEEVIGKFYTDKELNYSESQTLVPSYVYAAEAKTIFDTMVKLKKSCTAQTVNTTFCCNCQRFEEMGGDKMLEFLLGVIDNADTIASTVVELFDQDAYVSFAVDLSNTIYDFGYYTSAQSENCQKEVYYSSETSEDFDAPLEMPDVSNNIGTLWKRQDGVDTVWVASRDFDVVGDGSVRWRVLKKADVVELSGGTDSKLKSMRRYNTYLDDNGVPQTPETGTDWLYFYRKGYVANYDAVNDEFGNISFINDEPMNVDPVSGYVTNLNVYGTILTDITRDTDNKTITFEYYVNAHLMAKQATKDDGNGNTVIATGTDGDGHVLYYYEFPFVRESGGVRQTETYFYTEGGDLDESNLSQEDFQKLISLYTTDSSGAPEMDYAHTTNKKYEFFDAAGESWYKRSIFDNVADVRYIASNFEYAYKDIIADDCHAIFKEDYLNGIHYTPSVSSNVNIQRGNNAAFERHIRLGEIKTLEDMENYQNGAFFNMQTLV